MKMKMMIPFDRSGGSNRDDGNSSHNEIVMMAATTSPLWNGGDGVVQAGEMEWFNMALINFGLSSVQLEFVLTQ